nr:MAG TPA: hypothetical protein [Caudoviricetes sp.]
MHNLFLSTIILLYIFFIDAHKIFMNILCIFK